LHTRLNKEDLAWLAALPEQHVAAVQGAPPIRVVHGTPQSQTEHLMPDRDPACLRLFEKAGMLPAGSDPPSLSQVLVQIEETALVCGHSHIPWVQAEEGRLALNPGSVGAPVNGDVRAQYALLTWQGRWSVEHRAVPYDLERTRRAFHKSGLLVEAGPVGRALLLSVETGQAVLGLFVAHVHRLAAEFAAGRGACHTSPSVVQANVWEQAAATFDWAAYEGQRFESMPTGES
jgi:diadenosine tetraphosphatase ApaH/serine/threonine PP2A family protein phosphatase